MSNEDIKIKKRKSLSRSEVKRLRTAWYSFIVFCVDYFSISVKEYKTHFMMIISFSKKSFVLRTEGKTLPFLSEGIK